jgi:hypothetical protein
MPWISKAGRIKAAWPHSSQRLVLPFYVLACSLALATGCGDGGVHPVEGLVTWKSGAPAKELAGSLVFFELSETQTSSTGTIQEDGSFQLTTYQPNDGAPAGEHTVLILEVGRKSLGGPDSTAIAPSKIDTRYATPATSDLRATVKPGKNNITLVVEPPK